MVLSIRYVSADTGRTLDCVGATSFLDSLDTMAVDLNESYVFVSHVVLFYPMSMDTRQQTRCYHFNGVTLRHTPRPSDGRVVRRFRLQLRVIKQEFMWLDEQERRFLHAAHQSPLNGYIIRCLPISKTLYAEFGWALRVPNPLSLLALGASTDPHCLGRLHKRRRVALPKS